MSIVAIDTARARRAAAAWDSVADGVRRAADLLADELRRLALDGSAATRELAAAANEWRTAATFTRLVADEVERADRTAAGLADGHVLLGPGAVERLARRAIATGATDATSTTGARLLPAGSVGRCSPLSGDPGGTGSIERRSPYRTTGADPVARGRGLVARALSDTADVGQIRPDEFAIVDVGGGRFVVVLPGVTDLSPPDPGWSDVHRSVRDLDRAAIESSTSATIASNRYARMVVEQLRAAGVPVGAELAVVGHSFGADTALDLAADPAVNGPDGFRITHVVAAGYHSGPQLPHVPSSTSVLVLQSHRDIPVIVEAVADAHLTDAIASRWDVLRGLADGDLPGVVGGVGEVVRHDVGIAVAGVRHLVDRADDVGRMAGGAVTGDPWRVVEGATGLVTLEPGVSVIAPGHVVDVFVGGADGAGHHQHHYVDHVGSVDDPDVLAFLASLDVAGYTAPGATVAVDVSVP